MVIGIILVAIFAGLLCPHDPFGTKMENSLSAPSKENIFGTDKLGRDVFSRIIYGARYSLSMTMILITLIFVIGTFLGILAGYCGRILDVVIMRLGDIMISFPGLILAIAIAGLLGPSMKNAIIAITAVSWIKYARLSRSMVLSVKKSQYIEAAKILGTGHIKILIKHIIPNIITIMFVTAMMDIGVIMLEISALSFLGFGAQPPNPEWGLMLNEGRMVITSAPWLMVFPGLTIVAVVIIFNLFGESLKEFLGTQNQ